MINHINSGINHYTNGLMTIPRYATIDPLFTRHAWQFRMIFHMILGISPLAIYVCQAMVDTWDLGSFQLGLATPTSHDVSHHMSSFSTKVTQTENCEPTIFNHSHVKWFWKLNS